MGEIEVTHEIAIPVLGSLVNRASPDECARAYLDVQQAELALSAAKRELAGILLEHRVARGERILETPSGMSVTFSSDSQTLYDAEAIEEGLREAGMAEDRIREIVLEKVTYSVAAVEAKKAAAVNPEYRRVIEENSTVVAKTVYPTIKTPHV